MTSEGWLYLAVMIDLHSRAVVGGSVGSRMTADLVCKALEMALWRRSFSKHTIIHSNRGSQYYSAAYRDLIGKHKRHQIQTLSWKERIAKAITSAEKGVMEQVLVRIIPLIGADAVLEQFIP